MNWYKITTLLPPTGVNILIAFKEDDKFKYETAIFNGVKYIFSGGETDNICYWSYFESPEPYVRA